jgi:hypothetical protein
MKYPRVLRTGSLLVIPVAEVEQFNLPEFKGMAFGLQGDVSGFEQGAFDQGESLRQLSTDLGFAVGQYGIPLHDVVDDLTAQDNELHADPFLSPVGF